MKWRNQLLALFCLIAFAAGGVFYFQHWVIQKPFGIILFVAEGLAPGRLAMTRVYAAGADTPLTLDLMPHMALVTNASNDFAVSDQAAAATAIATGVKVNSRLLSCDGEGKTLSTLVELAHQSGRATGLITNVNITDPTAAAFYAHTLQSKVTNPPSPNSLSEPPRSIWSSVAVATIFSRNRRADIAGTGGICFWRFAATVLTSCAPRPNSKPFRAGAAQNSSVRLAMPNWLMEIT